MQVHRLRPGESWASWRWPCCGQVLHEDPQCPSRVLLDKVAQRQVPMAVSVRHLNRLRAKWKLQSAQRPPSSPRLEPSVCAGAAVVQVTPHLSFVGVHLFAHWLDQQETFDAGGGPTSAGDRGL